MFFTLQFGLRIYLLVQNGIKLILTHITKTSSTKSKTTSDLRSANSWDTVKTVIINQI